METMYSQSREKTFSNERLSDEDDRESSHLMGGNVIQAPKVVRSRGYAIGFYISSCINLILIVAVALVVIRSRPSGSVLLSSPTGLEFDQLHEYHFHTSYWNATDSVADAMWDSLSTDPVVVAIDDDWARRHNLPISARWPWDNNRGRYFVRAFHELHCLKYIRKYATNAQRGLPQDQMVPDHVLHCLDTLRQGVMCRADDTLEPTSDDTMYAIGDHELLKCRDWNKLSEWALAPERHACHRSLSDWKPIYHQMERYAFCPEGSPYQEVADKYFQEHGHHDPWQP